MAWLDGQLWDQAFLRFVLDVTLKSSAILLIAGLGALLLHRASAAIRHWVWSFSIFCVLLLPLLATVLPGWQVPLIPESVSTWSAPAAPAQPMAITRSVPKADQTPTPSTANSPAVDAPAQPKHQTVSGPHQEHNQPAPNSPAILGVGTPGQAMQKETSPEPDPAAQFSWLTLVFWVWLSGVGLVLGRLLLGMSWVRWMSRTAQRINEPEWVALVAECRQYLGIVRPVALWRGFHSTTPMTWGILRPVVLLPFEAEGWSHEMRRVVLMHELAHVKRCDTLTQMMAQVAFALFWFNPLMWWAVRRLRVEREHACDDHVLTAGAGASEYARHLLNIARNLRSAQVASLATIAMARRSQLEGRLLAILNPKQNRSRLTPLTALFLVITLTAVIVPLAAVQPWAPVAALPREGENPPEVAVEASLEQPEAPDRSDQFALDDQVQQGFRAVAEHIDSLQAFPEGGSLAQGGAADLDQQLEALIEAARRLLALTTERLQSLALQFEAGEDVVDQAKATLQRLSKDYEQITGQLAAALETLDAEALSETEARALEDRLYGALKDDIEALSAAAVALVDALNVWVELTLNAHGLAADDSYLGAFIAGITSKIVVKLQVEIAQEIRNLFSSIRFFQRHAGLRVIVIGNQQILIQTGDQAPQGYDGGVNIEITMDDVQAELSNLSYILDETLDAVLEDLGGALAEGLDKLDKWLERLFEEG